MSEHYWGHLLPEFELDAEALKHTTEQHNQDIETVGYCTVSTCAMATIKVEKTDEV